MNKVIGIENLRLKHVGGKSLLFKDLSLSIFEGQKVLILGPSGCGKSTLIQALSGLIPQAIDIPIKYTSLDKPKSWGYVFQDPDTQFCMPYVDEEMAFVLENLNVPREQMKELMSVYLQKVGLHLPDLHTKISNLSQGMKQRLAIASVLALEPDVLFLDEPTALLDPEGTEQVWESMKEVSRGKTVIIVEHKINHIVDFVDRVIIINGQGELVADGSSKEVFTTAQHELQEFGIWYPGVWENYLQSTTYQKIVSSRTNEVEVRAKQGDVSLSLLSNFKGYRGKEAKIHVPQAEINAGDWVAIVGENGAGKSTLLLSLMQLIKTSGTYTMNGSTLEGKVDLSQDIGFVFQNPEFQFVTNSVYEEIAYSLQSTNQLSPSFIKERVNHMINLFELNEHLEKHPYQLSIGQKRRLSVATAVVRQQKILLLDEPTFGQDARNTFRLLEHMEECRKEGTAIVMVTHDPHIVEHFATRVWVVGEGKLEKELLPTEYQQEVLNKAEGNGREPVTTCF